MYYWVQISLSLVWWEFRLDHMFNVQVPIVVHTRNQKQVFTWRRSCIELSRQLLLK